MPLFYPKKRPFDAFWAKIEASDQRFINPGSNHVKIHMKKEHFFALLF